MTALLYASSWMNEIKQFSFWENHSTEWPLKTHSRLSSLDTGGEMLL